jgi:sulfoxide reductase heme-binding subunit YedZ
VIDHTFWYISRAAGLTAYLLLTLNVILGLMVRTRALEWLLTRWRSFDLHRFTALLALGFLALHVFTLLGDRFIGYSLGELLIPFTSPYRTLWVALGIVGLYLLLLIVASFLVRRWIGYRAWRALHYATFGAFVLSLLHGILSGSDTSQIWALALYWGTGMLTAALTIWRFTADDRRRPAQPRSARSLDAALPDL